MSSTLSASTLALIERLSQGVAESMQHLPEQELIAEMDRADQQAPRLFTGKLGKMLHTHGAGAVEDTENDMQAVNRALRAAVLEKHRLLRRQRQPQN
jgi:hypothetical protein